MTRESSILLTFEKMGIQAQKSVAMHLLVENAHESNLLPDISKVNYLEGHQGSTRLQSIPDLPLFVDDLYVYGYLKKEQIVTRKGSIYLTTGTFGSGSYIVDRLRRDAKQTLGKNYNDNINAKILSTVKTTSCGLICKTVEKIERQVDNKIYTTWKSIHSEEPYGIFLAKLDVSEIPISELQERLDEFSKLLLGVGYGIYSIDYTRDFAGTMDRNALVKHLVENCGYREEGDIVSAMETNQPTILQNTSSVGNHVLTYMTAWHGYTIRVKLYNKIVCQFETGDVLQAFGGHLADYVDCNNTRLKKTFLHPTIQDYGCTRIEVSLYAASHISSRTGRELVNGVRENIYGENLFYKQSGANHWNCLAKHLDRCCCLADNIQGCIYMAWYAHTTTGKVVGVKVAPRANVLDDPKKWEKAVLWTCSEFGFKGCPIFRFDILAQHDDEGVEVSGLKCYMKNVDTKTILCSSKQPTKLHADASDDTLRDMLPPTDHVCWQWRKDKCQTIGVQKLLWELHEVPEFLAERNISALSTRNRAQRNIDLLDARSVELWQMEILAERKQRDERRKQDAALLQKKSSRVQRKTTNARRNGERGMGIVETTSKEITKRMARKLYRLRFWLETHKRSLGRIHRGSIYTRYTEMYIYQQGNSLCIGEREKICLPKGQLLVSDRQTATANRSSSTQRVCIQRRPKEYTVAPHTNSNPSLSRRIRDTSCRTGGIGRVLQRSQIGNIARNDT